MNLIDFNKLEVVDINTENIDHYIFDMELSEKLDTYNILDFMNFLEDIFTKLVADFKTQEARDVLLIIHTDLDPEDIPLIADNITGSFVSANLTGKPSDREEYRLNIPENMNGLVMLANHLMDCINKELVVSTFNIIIKDRFGHPETTLVGKDLI
jgi:hypothetical protein